jgi:hypothetical protein
MSSALSYLHLPFSCAWKRQSVMRSNRCPRKGADMPNPACGRIEATCRVKPGRNGSLESKHTRQDEELGSWMERMTNRNRSAIHPALMSTGTHVCLRVLHGERFFLFFARTFRYWLLFRNGGQLSEADVPSTLLLHDDRPKRPDG